MSTANPLTGNLNIALIDLTRRDPALANIYQKYGAPPRWSRKPGYATLVRIILEQQVSLSSARAIYRRLSASLGRVTPYTVIIAGDEELRKSGLTRQKSRYCLALANAVVGRQLDLNALQTMSGERVEACLTRVTGIGRWTSDVYCMMALGHADIWPRGDLALYKAMREVLQINVDTAALDKRAEQWGPWRSTAARLLWLYYLRTR